MQAITPEELAFARMVLSHKWDGVEVTSLRVEERLETTVMTLVAQVAGEEKRAQAEFVTAELPGFGVNDLILFGTMMTDGMRERPAAMSKESEIADAAREALHTLRKVADGTAKDVARERGSRACGE